MIQKSVKQLNVPGYMTFLSKTYLLICYVMCVHVLLRVCIDLGGVLAISLWEHALEKLIYLCDTFRSTRCVMKLL